MAINPNLPALQWGDISLVYTTTDDYRSEAVTDPTGLDLVAVRHHISVSGILASRLPPAKYGETPSQIMARIKHQAMRHRRYFRWGPFGQPIIEVGDKNSPNDPAKNYDVVGGPKCTDVSVEPGITEATFRVRMRFVVELSPCDDTSRAILSSRWSDDEEFDELGYRKVHRRGVIMLRYGHGLTTDQILDQAKLPRVEFGYQQMHSKNTLSPDGLRLEWSRQEHEFSDRGPPREAKMSKPICRISSNAKGTYVTLAYEMSAAAAKTVEAGLAPGLVRAGYWSELIRRLNAMVDNRRKQLGVLGKKGELPALQSQDIEVREDSSTIRYSCSFLGDPLKIFTGIDNKDVLRKDFLDDYPLEARGPTDRIEHRPPRVNAAANGISITAAPPQEPCGDIQELVGGGNGGQLTGGNGGGAGGNNNGNVGGELTGGQSGNGTPNPEQVDQQQQPNVGPGVDLSQYQNYYQFPEFIGTGGPTVITAATRTGDTIKVTMPPSNVAAMFGLAPATAPGAFAGVLTARSPTASTGGANSFQEPIVSLNNDGNAEVKSYESDSLSHEDVSGHTEYLIMWTHDHDTGRRTMPTHNGLNSYSIPFEAHSGSLKLRCVWTASRYGEPPIIPDPNPPKEDPATWPTSIVDGGREYDLPQHESNYVLTRHKIETAERRHGPSREILHSISGWYYYDVIDPDRCPIMSAYTPDALKSVQSLAKSQGLGQAHYPTSKDVIWWGLRAGPGQHAFQAAASSSSTTTTATTPTNIDGGAGGDPIPVELTDILNTANSVLDQLA